MTSKNGRLANLRVSDVMNRDVITIPSHSTMAEAAELLTQKEISGAPVVDEKGHCVGMLSTTDFARKEQEAISKVQSDVDYCDFELSGSQHCQSFQIEHVAHDCVMSHMSSAPQTIKEDAMLVESARYMVVGHIHRLVVVDDFLHPIGILTSLDIVATLVQVFEEKQ